MGGDLGGQGLDKDVRSRVELPSSNAMGGALIGAQTPTFSTAIITPTSGGKFIFVYLFIFYPSMFINFCELGAPLQMFPIVSAGTPLGTPLGTPAGTPIRIVGSPTTPQNSQFGFLQKLKTIVPPNTNIISPVFPRHFDLTGSAAMGSPASLGGSTRTDGSFSSHPPTPQTPVSATPSQKIPPTLRCGLALVDMAST